MKRWDSVIDTLDFIEKQKHLLDKKTCFGNYLVSNLTGCGDCQQRDACLLDSKDKPKFHM